MRGKWLPSALGLVAAASLLWGIGDSALWDPHELRVAELSRRIALNLLGGAGLAIPGADNELPVRADLGQGELPFTSVALGLRVFGLSEWAGRLPLVVWSLLALGVLYAAVTRLAERRTALYAVLVLATTPLFFLQARTLLGDAVTLASFTIAWSGLSVALLAPAQSARARWVFGAVGLLGLYAGFWCRGPVVSVAVPALSISLSALLAPQSPRARRWSVALALLGAASLLVGALGWSLSERTREYSVFVGSALGAPAVPTTFDLALAQLLHAAFPWSALCPLVLARAFASETVTPARPALLALSFSLVAASWLAPSLGLTPIPAVACLAVLVAVALRQLEEQPRALPTLGLACAGLSVLLGLDLVAHPDKALRGFGLPGLLLPASLEGDAARLFRWSGVAFGAVVALSLLERDDDPTRPAFRRDEYASVLRKLARVWDGNLVFALLVLEAALVGFLALSAVSERLVRLEHLEPFGSFSRRLVAVAAIAVPLATLAPLAALAARDGARVLFGRGGRWLPVAPTRSQAVIVVGFALGLAASLGFYPRFAQQVAPKQVLERYRELGRAGEPLGIVGGASVAARYQAGTSAEQLASVPSAFEWLVGGGNALPRRWLLLRAASLPQLNASFRERFGLNLPVLDARSSELLLSVSRLEPHERDDNPLAALVLSRAPTPQYPLRAVLGGQLELLGFALSDASGRPAASVLPGTPYRFIIYWRVLSRLRGEWQTFVHLDGLQRRFNADHEPLGGRYPMSAWRPGDILVDATELLLEPNFSPGHYRVHLGLYRGDARLEVTEGPAVDNRIAAGTLRVE